MGRTGQPQLQLSCRRRRGGRSGRPPGRTSGTGGASMTARIVPSLLLVADHVEDGRVDDQPPEQQEPGQDGEDDPERAVQLRTTTPPPWGRSRRRATLRTSRPTAPSSAPGQQAPATAAWCWAGPATSTATARSSRRRSPGPRAGRGSRGATAGRWWRPRRRRRGRPRRPARPGRRLVLHAAVVDLPDRVVGELEGADEAEPRPQQAEEADDGGRLAALLGGVDGVGHHLGALALEARAARRGGRPDRPAGVRDGPWEWAATKPSTASATRMQREDRQERLEGEGGGQLVAADVAVAALDGGHRLEERQLVGELVEERRRFRFAWPVGRGGRSAAVPVVALPVRGR